VKWFKRYAIGCLIWLALGGAVDAYKHPDGETRMGAIVVVAAAWPIVTAVVVGGAVGDIVRDIKQGKFNTDGTGNS